MLDTIGFIASILGIIGAVLASVKFIFKPYLERRQQYKDIKNLVDERFQRWKELDFTLRGGAIIEREDFLRVNKFKSKLSTEDEELIAFLFRNAIQNGLSGDWGFWLNANKNNKVIIPILITVLNENQDRPMWRASYILEKLFHYQPSLIVNFIPESVINAPKVLSMLKIIQINGIQREINKIIKDGPSEIKKKAQMVKEEFELFSQKINTFLLEQSIIPYKPNPDNNND